MIVKCPNCKKPVVWEETPTRPFCSPRCKLIDLGRWLDEDYSIAADEADDFSEDDRNSTVH